jgi:hypothetical protein
MKLRADKVLNCLIVLGSEYFVFSSDIEKRKDEQMQSITLLFALHGCEP